jgi:hypothetical protein
MTLPVRSLEPGPPGANAMFELEPGTELRRRKRERVTHAERMVLSQWRADLTSRNAPVGALDSRPRCLRKRSRTFERLDLKRKPFGDVLREGRPAIELIDDAKRTRGPDRNRTSGSLSRINSSAAAISALAASIAMPALAVARTLPRWDRRSVARPSRSGFPATRAGQCLARSGVHPASSAC